MSNQAGRSNLVARLNDAGIEVERNDSRLSEITGSLPMLRRAKQPVPQVTFIIPGRKQA